MAPIAKTKRAEKRRISYVLVQAKMAFVKTLSSEILRQEFCVLVSCCHAGQAQREADRIVDLDLREGGIPQEERSKAKEEDEDGTAASTSKDKSKSGCRDLDLCVKRSKVSNVIC